MADKLFALVPAGIFALGLVFAFLRWRGKVKARHSLPLLLAMLVGQYYLVPRVAANMPPHTDAAGMWLAMGAMAFLFASACIVAASPPRTGI